MSKDEDTNEDLFIPADQLKPLKDVLSDLIKADKAGELEVVDGWVRKKKHKGGEK